MCKQINPDIAAHNIASIFIQEFIRKSNNDRILDVNGTEICTAAKKATDIYSIVYDEVHEQISKANLDLINNPD